MGLGVVEAVTRAFEDPPEPLVPAHVDLNGYEFMPLYGELLKRSSFNRDATDAEFRAGVNLWWSSWWEIPAASLPNNELDLARLAGLKTIRAWRKVRDHVLGKWVLCADNRWYHPILANFAVRTFATRKSQSEKGRLGAQKLWENKRGSHAPANGTGIERHGSGNAPASAPARKINGPGNGNRSEVNTPLTPHASHSIEAAKRVIEDNLEAAAHAALPPTGDVASFFEQHTGKRLRTHASTTPPEADHDPGETLDT
jgi:hypothetical protein